MTPSQIADVIAATGETTDSPLLIKFIRCGSGATYSIQASPGRPGRYNLTFNDANELVLLEPASAADSTVSGVLPYEMISYDSIEAIGFWPAGTAIA